MKLKARTYSKCKKCGLKEEGVCGIMYGHICDNCGAKDAAKIIVRKRKGEE